MERTSACTRWPLLRRSRAFLSAVFNPPPSEEMLARFPLVPFHATRMHDRPSRLTLQVSEHEHIELGPAFLECVNHGCDPNVAFDVEHWVLRALRPVAPGDELVFFYPSTEWAMVRSSSVLASSTSRSK